MNRNRLIIYVLSLLVGVISGTIAALFGIVLLKITAFREINYIYLLPFLSLIGLFIVYLYNKIGGVKGMGDVFRAAKSENYKLSLFMVPFVIITTWITHLFGGSAGREGVSVQIGAVVGYNVGEKFNSSKFSHILLISGMAAGFSGLFQTPIAAIFFALEVLSLSYFRYYALIPTIIASLSSYATSRFIGLEKFSVDLSVTYELDYVFLLKLLVLGVCFGFIGKLFAELLCYFSGFFKDIFKSNYKKIFFIGLFVSLFSIFIHSGRYSGLGTNLISSSFYGGKIYFYDWILKLLFTVITIAAGFQGGEVTPLFSIGASFGLFFSSFLGLPIMLGAALGYAAVFSSSTKTLLAPIFIGAEVFGFEYIPIFALVCSISYVVSGKSTIYNEQDFSFIDMQKL
ncbi:MAG: voltage-gated chloride channel protein [Clostridiales bacterium]|nr:MAG: voltage-gated chloride channel protein [Clostridiales bacterium]